ncbi:hypothetical protein ACFL2V_04665 [Pseudomonadota bacterium]
MAESKQEKINIRGNDSGANEGVLNVLVLSSRDRIGRAGKVLAISWVLAVITLFIPIAHFFLVPLFALGGPVMAYMKYSAEEVTEDAKGICPECNEAVTIKLDPADKLPKWTYCPACNKPLQLVYHSPSLNS